MHSISHRSRLLAGSAILGVALAFGTAHAQAKANFYIPAQDLPKALAEFGAQSGFEIIADSSLTVAKRSPGVSGDVDPDVALSHMLRGTGLTYRRTDGSYVIVAAVLIPRPAQPVSAASAVESVVVTSSKIKGDIQTVPIAITALSQEQLTSRQIAGGPDLVKEVPNLTFSKTNFTGYNIQIRGIGTQAISVTTDPAVAVAFNDIPFIRNHFFEQEFYDVGQVEVLRGPQGTLYGRNATAGVVNVVSAKPTDQFEAVASADFGNFHNRRFEGMVNIPIVDDRADIRIAGEWTKRDGYSFNALTNAPIDGRNLWSTRVSLGLKPSENLQIAVIWEHFQENDDRIRSSKQLCKTAPIPSEVGGVPIGSGGSLYAGAANYLSQGCLPASFYSAESFQVPNGFSLAYVVAPNIQGLTNIDVDPYASVTQSRNLRVIESSLDPAYTAKNDIVELNTDYSITPALTFTAQTGFNHDFLWSTEDYNRFNTNPGVLNPAAAYRPNTDAGGDVFCDPQLGCSNRLVAEDLSDEHSWQLSQEFRLSSNFSGPFNFSAGANYLHYETEENYYVFINSLTLLAATPAFGAVGLLPPWDPGVSDNHECLIAKEGGFVYSDPSQGSGPLACGYIDPNPLTSLNNEGHNYFLSQNPYVLNSYAGFGEVYYTIADELKLIGGVRWTDDEKHFIDIPSELLVAGYGYPSTGAVNQKWNKWTGRFAANWSPKLDFADQTLIYGSYSRGYKAGGANPPGAVFIVNSLGDIANPIHPTTFKPEFVDAFELGTKNTLLDGSLTLNGDVFYYNYKSYQISEIVDRTSINLNFDATVKGAELETTWEASPGLKFTFAGGYEDTRLADDAKAVDLMDRTAGNPDWVVVKPFVTQASNCILPAYVAPISNYNLAAQACGDAYNAHVDPVTGLAYVANPTEVRNIGGYAPVPDGYPGFDPVSSTASNNGAGPAPNNGAGFDKNLGGNELPNAPHFTTSLTAEYTMPVSEDWAATLHGDFYWQSQSFARVFNDRPYDKLRGYSNVNVALILTSGDGWQVLGYLKNVFDTTAITGAFLNSDDTGLTTNVFLTDPRLYGVRVTKNF